MNDKYDAGEHNSMREPYVAYDISSVYYVSFEDIENAKKRQEEMQKKHAGQEKIDIWQGVV